jgi:SAM-dependent methyltransferase
LEFARTQEHLLRHLPPPPARILDVGGGPGRYSAWLVSLGYEVHLIDITPRHIEQARTIAGLASVQLGDARRLRHAEASVDAVLLFGPLYHLTERADRLEALAESYRVLRSGGLLCAAAISRFASLLDGLVEGFLFDPGFAAIVERDLRDGQHRNTTGHPGHFTTAFFHHPDELRSELVEAGFVLLDLIGVEGPSWLTPGFEQHWNDPGSRETLLTAARLVEREPTLLGVSLHLLAMGRKPVK